MVWRQKTKTFALGKVDEQLIRQSGTRKFDVTVYETYGVVSNKFSYSFNEIESIDVNGNISNDVKDENNENNIFSYEPTDIDSGNGHVDGSDKRSPRSLKTGNLKITDEVAAWRVGDNRLDIGQDYSSLLDRKQGWRYISLIQYTDGSVLFK